MSESMRDSLSEDELKALPDGHPWKTEGSFSFGGIDFFPADDSVVDDYERQQKAFEAAKRKERLEHDYRNASGVPERYWDESLDTYSPTDGEAERNLEAVRKFTQSRKRGKALILCGNNGTGKSHLGCGAIREVGGQYVSVLKLLYMIDSSMSYRAKETKMEILDRLSRTPGVLVLDEIGRGVREEAMKELVVYLMCERYAMMKDIIIISNLPKLELIKWLGLAVKDRLNETCIVLEFNGESYRSVKRGELYTA